MSEFLLGVDIGTSSSKGMLAHPDGEIIATSERPHELSLPRPGWAEHDAEQDHRHHRLNHGPQHAEHGLLVAHFQSAPDEEPNELAVGPELAERAAPSRLSVDPQCLRARHLLRPET